MKITINGIQKVLEGNITISALMQELQLDARKIAIEKNLEIIPANEYMATYLKDGDVLEVVQFIGGG